jgi:hypothetical protein
MSAALSAALLLWNLCNSALQQYSACLQLCQQPFCCTIRVRHTAVQCSTVQYSAVQYSTVQYSTVQYMPAALSAALSLRNLSIDHNSTVHCSTVYACSFVSSPSVAQSVYSSTGQHTRHVCWKDGRVSLFCESTKC